MSRRDKIAIAIYLALIVLFVVFASIALAITHQGFYSEEIIRKSKIRTQSANYRTVDEDFSYDTVALGFWKYIRNTHITSYNAELYRNYAYFLSTNASDLENNWQSHYIYRTVEAENSYEIEFRVKYVARSDSHLKVMFHNAGTGVFLYFYASCVKIQLLEDYASRRLDTLYYVLNDTFINVRLIFNSERLEVIVNNDTDEIFDHIIYNPFEYITNPFGSDMLLYFIVYIYDNDDLPAYFILDYVHAPFLPYFYTKEEESNADVLTMDKIKVKDSGSGNNLFPGINYTYYTKIASFSSEVVYQPEDVDASDTDYAVSGMIFFLKDGSEVGVDCIVGYFDGGWHAEFAVYGDYFYASEPSLGASIGYVAYVVWLAEDNFYYVAFYTDNDADRKYDFYDIAKVVDADEVVAVRISHRLSDYKKDGDKAEFYYSFGFNLITYKEPPINFDLEEKTNAGFWQPLIDALMFILTPIILLLNKILEFLGNLIGGLVSSFVNDFINPLVSAFIDDFITPLVNAFKDNFIGPLVSAFVDDFITPLVNAFKDNFINPLVSAFVEQFINPLWNWLVDSAGNVWNAFVGYFQNFVKWALETDILGLGWTIGDLLDTIWAFIGVWKDAVIGFWTIVSNFIDWAVDNVPNYVEALITYMPKLFDLLLSMFGIIPIFLDYIHMMIALITGLSAYLGILLVILPYGIAYYIVQKLNETEDISDFVDMFYKIWDIFQSALSIIIKVFNLVINAILQFINAITPFT